MDESKGQAGGVLTPVARLKPCPFCGGAMQLREALDISDGGVDAVIHAEPTDCGLSFDIGTADHCASVIAAWNTRPTPAAAAPIDMLLFCPKCGMQHVDAPDRLEQIVHAGSGTVVDEVWTNPPHKSHLCHGCRCVWRPADVPTNGVAKIATTGKADNWVAASPAVPTETPEQEAFCDTHCCWSGHHPDCFLASSPVAPVGAPTEELADWEKPTWENVRYVFAMMLFGATLKPRAMWEKAIDNAAEAGPLKFARALLSAQGCELATDATKQLGEPSVHLAVNDAGQDFRMRPASSETAPSAAVLRRAAEALAAYMGAMRADTTDDRGSIMARIKAADAAAQPVYAELHALIAQQENLS